MTLAAMAALAFVVSSAHAGKKPSHKREVTFMTRNCYVGADLMPIVLAPDPNLIPLLVAQTYAEIVASDFPARAVGLAKEIAWQKPDVAALQEMSLIRVQDPGDEIFPDPQDAEEVVYDYLAILLDELARRGLHYEVVSSVENMDLELFSSPSFEDLLQGRGMDVRLTDRDVILARTDLPRGHLNILNAQAGNFENNLTVLVAGYPLSITRGWCSVDTFVRGRVLRIINAHLEDALVQVRTAQAAELLAGPADFCLPVIMLGDFNSDANGNDPAEAYPLFLEAGFVDAWTVVHPNQPGLTWGHDALLADPTVPFIWRLDLVMYRGCRLEARQATVLDARLPRNQPPLWASDHAGISTTIRVR